MTPCVPSYVSISVPCEYQVHAVKGSCVPCLSSHFIEIQLSASALLFMQKLALVCI